MRDLLTLLGIDKATVVGHSFGGGVAMQYAYQFPERTERLALVAPGGLGPEVSVFIRALTLPGASAALSVAGLAPFRPIIAGGLTVLSRSRLPHTRDLAEVADIYRRMLCDPQGRFAVRHVTSAVVDWRGQIVTMTDRAYLTRLMPMCVIWGQDDDVIPVTHAYSAQAYAPGVEVHVVARAGHFPHKEQPERVAQLLTAFVDSTAGATYHRGRWRRLMQRGDLAELAAIPDRPAVEAAPGRRGSRRTRVSEM
jgi:pimeloyl-ACP methyl ester carboxylesterase